MEVVAGKEAGGGCGFHEGDGKVGSNAFASQHQALLGRAHRAQLPGSGVNERAVLLTSHSSATTWLRWSPA